jgi:CRP/FNR family transcriptional regulator, cyclic AMP receptor protein
MNNHGLLSAYLAANASFSKDELLHVLTHFKPRLTKRNEILLAQGDLCQHIYFVNRGYLRMYYVQPDGQEATRYLAFEGELGTALASFVSQEPALDFMQTDEPSDLLFTSYPDLQKLLREVPAMEKIYRINLELTLLIHTRRLESFLTMDARERYDHLVRNQPTLVQRLSNRVMASYLGITQETLSRLKARK